MNRLADIQHQFRENAWALCSVSLLFVLNTSCHKSAPTQPPSGSDTTNHNFTWQITTLGDGLASSMLNDVAIINDSLIYAVGEIYLKDSTGQEDPRPYNVALWNGNSSNIGRIPYYYEGQALYQPIRWVYAFSESDIWFENSVRWNGSAFEDVDIGTSVFLGIGSLKMWGSADGLMYVVGNNGTIAYSSTHGTMWQKLESGTTFPIQDIWGATNPANGQTEILAIASNTIAVPSGKKLIRIAGTTLSSVSDSGLSFALSGIWFVSNEVYFVVGGGIYLSETVGPNTIWTSESSAITAYYTEDVRGNSPNDIFIVGDYGEILHFNGASWRSFHSDTRLTDGRYRRVAVAGNLVIAVGNEGNQAVVAIGRRH